MIWTETSQSVQILLKTENNYAFEKKENRKYYKKNIFLPKQNLKTLLANLIYFFLLYRAILLLQANFNLLQTGGL